MAHIVLHFGGRQLPKLNMLLWLCNASLQPQFELDCLQLRRCSVLNLQSTWLQGCIAKRKKLPVFGACHVLLTSLVTTGNTFWLQLADSCLALKAVRQPRVCKTNHFTQKQALGSAYQHAMLVCPLMLNPACLHTG